jgi:hypothetical protein
MKKFTALLVAALLVSAGCNDAKPTAGSSTTTKAAGADNDVAANLGKLSAEDRSIADAQKLCPITDEPLGSMGVPIKLTIKDQSVFICCKSCTKNAEKDADKTLRKVAELKAKNANDK